MGLFTYVKVEPELLPEDYQHLTGWQTKNVVEPSMETLIIEKDKQLYYLWYECEWEDDPSNKFFGGYFKHKAEHKETLDYHGDMLFYNWDEKEKRLIELVARFSNGKLDYIKEYENEVF
jgi:hypothetical protein